MSDSSRQSEATASPTGGAIAAAMLAALQVEAAQFVLVFSGAWLFGVGIPATIAPATGVRLHSAMLMALASRHPTRLLRLPLEAWRWRVVRRGLRHGGFEYLTQKIPNTPSPRQVLFFPTGSQKIGLKIVGGKRRQCQS